MKKAKPHTFVQHSDPHSPYCTACGMTAEYHDNSKEAVARRRAAEKAEDRVCYLALEIQSLLKALSGSADVRVNRTWAHSNTDDDEDYMTFVEINGDRDENFSVPGMPSDHKFDDEDSYIGCTEKCLQLDRKQELLEMKELHRIVVARCRKAVRQLGKLGIK